MFFAVERLGPKRVADEAFRQKTLIDRPNSRVILGSDFPVEPPTPFGGMYAAVTRLSPITGTSPHGPEGWFKEERISIEEAFAGFTKEAAYGSFWEGRAGQIKKGGWADFVLVDQDFFLEDLDLRNVKVQATWVGGEKVWDGGSESDTDAATQIPMLPIVGLQEVFQ
jgi:predicted amidohydrolase YtcJ